MRISVNLMKEWSQANYVCTPETTLFRAGVFSAEGKFDRERAAAK